MPRKPQAICRTALTGATLCLTRLEAVSTVLPYPRRPPGVNHSARSSVARILIVEDEEADRRLLEAILERAGHEIVFAENGQEALEQFKASSIDLVVTDLHLPEVHGFELITVLRDVQPRPAVIAVSGTGQFQLHMAEALGAKWTLAKPVDPELLLNAVEGALGGDAPPEDAQTTGGRG